MLQMQAITREQPGHAILPNQEQLNNYKNNNVSCILRGTTWFADNNNKRTYSKIAENPNKIWHLSTLEMVS